MVLVNDSSLLRAIFDVLSFLVISIAYCIRGIFRIFVSAPYRHRCDGEIVLVTGAGSGIGQLVATKLAALGATIVVWDINECGILETVQMITANGGQAFGYRCNIANRDEVYYLAAKVTQDVGEVTILINNAGVVSGDYLLKTPDNLIQRTFDVNILAHFWTTKAFLPKMIEKNNGHIVTIASMAGFVGMSKLVDYCSSKFAAVGFDEALRIELEAQKITGVKTLCVCPYFIQSTGMFEDVMSRFLPRLKSTDVADRIVLGILRDEILVMLPAHFRYLYFLKWMLPWGVMSMVLHNMVADAAPQSAAGGNAGKTSPSLVSNIDNGSAGPFLKQRVIKDKS